MKGKNKSRRDLIQSAGVSFVGLASISGIATANAEDIGDFDPNDSEEVREFVVTHDPLNNPELAEYLTREQQEAVLDFYADVEWEYNVSTTGDNVEVTSSSDGVTLASDGNPGYVHVEAYGSTGATREYTFNANFSWTWYGDGNGYSDVDSDSNGHSNAIAGRYLSGSRNYGHTTTWDNYFHAYETGQFQLHFGTAWRTVTAKVKIRGDDEGKHNILEKRAPL